MQYVTVTLYKLDELNDKARQKAICEHRYFLLSIMSPSDFISGDEKYDTPEELQKAYNSEYDYILFNDEPVIESIEINDYYFFFDGSIADVRHYGNGKHVFTFSGETDVFYEK